MDPYVWWVCVLAVLYNQQTSCLLVQVRNISLMYQTAHEDLESGKTEGMCCP